MRTYSVSNNPQTQEINLRQETIDIIYGKGITPPRGTWLIYRKSNTSKYSQYWNDERKEAIGGPAWEYDDYLIRARINSVTSGNDQEYRDVLANIESPISLFYTDYRMNVKKEDYFLEIDQNSGIIPPSKFTVVAKYDILLVKSPRDQFGRIAYYMCYCKKEVSRGDRTLDNINIKEIINGNTRTRS